MESILGDSERARAIYELAVEQSRLDMPESLWKAFIDFEIEQEEYDRARKLYTKLLKRTQHVKVRKKNDLIFHDHIFDLFFNKRFGLVWRNLKHQLMKRILLIVHEMYLNKLIKPFEQQVIKKNV